MHHDNPRLIKDFHLISLCNILYKIIAKVLANQLKVFLPKLLSVEQSAFILGWSTVDNVIAAFEAIHYPIADIIDAFSASDAGLTTPTTFNLVASLIRLLSTVETSLYVKVPSPLST